MEDDITFTITEVAEYLKVSVPLIRKLVRKKVIPFYRVGARLFFKKSSVQKWILQQEIDNLLDSAVDEIKIKPLKSEVK